VSVISGWHYYRRILRAYLGPGRSQLTFWHETPEVNSRATSIRLGDYYMQFREKADYAGHYDGGGIPMLDYHGVIGLQYNPIAIAQWGLANYNRFSITADAACAQKTLKAANWLAASLEQNPRGLWVWNHHFDWEYRDTLKAPWYSGLAQGQGISLLLRAQTIVPSDEDNSRYNTAADKAFVSLTTPMSEGGVLFEDAEKNLWIEEYLVSPPTHILNGFIWALWGLLDYWLARADASAKQLFDRGVQTLLFNLPRYDTGYWSLYEQSGTDLRMLASPFYHRLHIVQLRIMSIVTGNSSFAAVADRWQSYADHRFNRGRALFEKSIFKLLHY
jgi:hypothetical protein